jgi:hypothetical protein
MSFKDLGNKNATPHVDTPAEAEARAQAVADVKAKADAKAARAAAKRKGEPSKGEASRNPGTAPNEPKDRPAKT